MIQIIESLDNYIPKNKYAFLVKKYFEDIIKYGTKKYIKNIDVDVKILEINDKLIPITFWNNKENACFSSSLIAMFNYLSLESNKSIKNIFIKKFLIHFSKIIQKYIQKYQLYNCIFVNNFLLSTNFYPLLNKEELQEMKNFLKEKYPHYCIIFRWVNEFEEQALNDFKEIWFKKIIFRQVYIGYKENFQKYIKIKEVKSDKKLFEKSKYILEKRNTFSEEEIDQIRESYENLYIQKYSNLNPQITNDFIKNIAKDHIFQFWILKNSSNEICAVYSYYNAFWQVASPIFWYRKDRLYRHLTHCFFQEVTPKFNIINWSSGVWDFKINRWNEKKTEFFCIYYSHLNTKQKIIWKIISLCSKYIGEPYFKKYSI